MDWIGLDGWEETRYQRAEQHRLLNTPCFLQQEKQSSSDGYLQQQTERTGDTSGLKRKKKASERSSCLRYSLFAVACKGSGGGREGFVCGFFFSFFFLLFLFFLSRHVSSRIKLYYCSCVFPVIAKDNALISETCTITKMGWGLTALYGSGNDITALYSELQDSNCYINIQLSHSNSGSLEKPRFLPLVWFFSNDNYFSSTVTRGVT